MPFIVCCFLDSGRLRILQKNFREEGSAPGVAGKGESPLRVAPKMLNVKPAELGGGKHGNAK